MTNDSLARAYLEKARKRLAILPVLLEQEAFSDVVRESQEVVELALKGMLRQVGVEPPRWHDEGSLLIEHRARFGDDVRDGLEELAAISTWLRKEREFSFCGDIDFIPTEHYDEATARRAMEDASRTVADAALVIPER